MKGVGSLWKQGKGTPTSLYFNETQIFFSNRVRKINNNMNNEVWFNWGVQPKNKAAHGA